MIVTQSVQLPTSALGVFPQTTDTNALYITFGEYTNFWLTKAEAITFAKLLLKEAGEPVINYTELVKLSDRICRAHETGNNGAIMGEATLCPSFATALRATLDDILLARVQS